MKLKLITPLQKWEISTSIESESDLQLVHWLKIPNKEGYYQSGSYIQLLSDFGQPVRRARITRLFFSSKSFFESERHTHCIRFNIQPVKIDFKNKTITNLKPDQNCYYFRHLGNLAIRDFQEDEFKLIYYVPKTVKIQDDPPSNTA